MDRRDAFDASRPQIVRHIGQLPPVFSLRPAGRDIEGSCPGLAISTFSVHAGFSADQQTPRPMERLRRPARLFGRGDVSDKSILIVGAGFAGAVHARQLAEAGYQVRVIDKRPHIAGNAFDYVDDNGVRVHAYGPHLFHTKQKHIVEWLERFSAFVPYTHKVRAFVAPDKYVPLPINLHTINSIFGVDMKNESEAKAFLASVAIPCDAPQNAADYLYSKLGRMLTDLFFRPYTKKMWLMDLEDMSASVVQRIPINYDTTDTYFSRDELQMMPENGYTAIFESILDHENIRVETGVAYEKDMESACYYCFNSMPIDEYFEFRRGRLPYRSIRFHHRTVDAFSQDWSVTNFTDSSAYTRETAWHVIPRHRVHETSRATITREEPCDYIDNNFERYYPVKTADGRYQALYALYKEDAAALPNMSFIGRCGTYQYLDMDQVINQSLAQVNAWIARDKVNGENAAPLRQAMAIAG
jgi:UDP-galactopyranose mutase